MPKIRVFADTNVILESFRTGCWTAISNHFAIETVEKCVEETLTGNPGDPRHVAVLPADLMAGLALQHPVTRKELATLVLSHPSSGTLDDGEKHLFAWVLANKLLPSQVTPKPPVNRLPRRKVRWQHAPLTARPYQIADGVEDIAQVSDATTAPQGRLGQQRCDEFPLRVRQVARVTLTRCSALRLARTGLFGPHDGLRLKRPLDIADHIKIMFSNRH